MNENRVVFLAADVNPSKQLGVAGAYLPQYRTVPDKTVAKGRLTVLTPTRQVEPKAMIAPTSRKEWKRCRD